MRLYLNFTHETPVEGRIHIIFKLNLKVFGYTSLRVFVRGLFVQRIQDITELALIEVMRWSDPFQIRKSFFYSSPGFLQSNYLRM
jgi:hypothetical protein